MGRIKVTISAVGHKPRKTPKRVTKDAMYGSPRGGWSKGGGWDKHGGSHSTQGSASIRVFADEIQKNISKAIQNAAASAAVFTQKQLMEMAKEKYEELGLPKHELTGNTRNSVMSAIYSGGKKVGQTMKMADTPPATGPMLSLNGDDRFGRRGGYRYFFVKHYRTGKTIRYPYWKVVDTSGRFADEESFEYLKQSIKGNKNVAAEIHVVGMQQAYRPELVDLMRYLKDNAQRLLHDFLQQDLMNRVNWNRGFYEAMMSYRKN